MILPKVALISSATGRFGRPPCLRMDMFEGKITVNQFNPSPIPFHYLSQSRMGLLAKRTLEVREFHQRHRCLGRAAQRCTLDRHVNADYRRRLETNQNLSLRPERFQEELPPSG